MPNYFQNFQAVGYRFGDNEAPVLFDNLTQYVDIIDSMKDQISFYNKYTIVSGERPDTLSYELYGTTDYYWTFFLMNDHLRLSGWPVNTEDLLDIIKSKYPYQVITTSDDIANSFPVGQTVTGTPSGTTGKIIARRLDLGQLIIDTGGDTFGDRSNNESISYTDAEGSLFRASVYGTSAQYNAVHHYEDTDGNHVDIDPHDQANIGSSLIPVTFRDRVEERNEELKEIVVLKTEVIERVVSEFNKSLLSES